MGIKNYLIEGVSCTGKTSVCEELERRGYHTVHGDRVLAYRGDPATGEPLVSTAYEHWIWDVATVKEIVADKAHAATFFCGGSRNFHQFIDLFDGVFVLEIDLETFNQRLALRTQDDWAGPANEAEANARSKHASHEDVPKDGIRIDGTAPIEDVVDAILEQAGLAT
jgi:broad-specificity NMP kinase